MVYQGNDSRITRQLSWRRCDQIALELIKKHTGQERNVAGSSLYWSFYSVTIYRRYANDIAISLVLDFEKNSYTITTS